MIEGQMAAGDSASIPLYSLYGQIDGAAELRFIHLETIESRNRYYNWHIRPHRHHDLHQVVWVERGGGPVILDDRQIDLKGPVLINIPPTIVHGFQWTRGAQGFVLTMAENFMTDLCLQTRDPVLQAAMSQVLVMTEYHDDHTAARVAGLFAMLNDEYAHERVCRTATIAGHVLILLTEIARLRQRSQRRLHAARVRGSEAYQHFKELVEEHFSDHWPVGAYAATLAITERSLRRLTLKFSNQTPIQIIHRRMMLEAKRNLLYTEKSIAAVGYVLGFEDPAYFTRFFIKNARETPLQFRRARTNAA
ncbi:MAG: helix-turn-helix domain-containing protein [Alcaligenaceae bacterium]|nr:helix-turn-helix domain-containing protein [Alcaligenaceae bacterium]